MSQMVPALRFAFFINFNVRKPISSESVRFYMANDRVRTEWRDSFPFVFATFATEWRPSGATHGLLRVLDCPRFNMISQCSLDWAPTWICAPKAQLSPALFWRRHCCAHTMGHDVILVRMHCLALTQTCFSHCGIDESFTCKI